MKTMKITAVLVAALFLLALLFSLFYLVAESGHDCAGEDCPVCRVIATIGNVLKSLSVVSFAVLFSAVLGRSAVGLLSRTDREIFETTPVSLKVKLSD